MSFEASHSQDSSIYSRDQEGLPKDSASQLNTGFISLIESAQAPSYQQGFPTQTTTWSFNAPAPALENHPEPSHNFSTSLQRSHNSTASLDSSVNIPSSILHPNTPLAGQSDQSSFDIVGREEQLTDDQGSGLGITSYPMSVASETYFAGPMQPHSQRKTTGLSSPGNFESERRHSFRALEEFETDKPLSDYAWADRPFQPLQSPPGNINQQFPPPQPYPQTGYPVGYSGQTGGPLSNYHQELPAPSSYLSTSTAPGSAQRQYQSRRCVKAPRIRSKLAGSLLGIRANICLSPSISRHFPPHSAAGHMPDQPLMASSHTSSMMHDPIYSHDSVNAASNKEQQLHAMGSRPRPQCWDHGCNGREFSTFSNLLRHQREKSGVVAKAECPVCGAVFTRTTARNIHVAQGKCKGAGRESPNE
ncbi:hypothetical protein N7481_006049 [Penicillium waksmanii]|uniref:uncharacterized protein n=1 Tax=Penicillium waksmanii TaxID=69791 RepID=UPI002546ABEE|nr:uncharacterized protein N7481_006049 [Penicillium waksmanii]KAJ5983950.1 hypothetical protein N7481_006049 [Penicillium waksmanii]